MAGQDGARLQQNAKGKVKAFCRDEQHDWTADSRCGCNIREAQQANEQAGIRGTVLNGIMTAGTCSIVHPSKHSPQGCFAGG